jgi:hypothetical protein
MSLILAMKKNFLFVVLNLLFMTLFFRNTSYVKYFFLANLKFRVIIQ